MTLFSDDVDDSQSVFFLICCKIHKKNTAAAIPWAALSCSQNLASGFGLESCKIVKRSENYVK